MENKCTVVLVKERDSKTRKNIEEKIEIDRKRFGELLVDCNLITEKQRDISVKIQQLIRSTLKSKYHSGPEFKFKDEEILMQQRLKELLGENKYLLKEDEIPREINNEFKQYVNEIRRCVDSGDKCDFLIGSIIANVYGTDQKSMNNFYRIAVKWNLLVNIIKNLKIKRFEDLYEKKIFSIKVKDYSKDGKRTNFSISFGPEIYSTPPEYQVEISDIKWDLFDPSFMKVSIGNIDNLVLWINNLIGSFEESTASKEPPSSTM